MNKKILSFEEYAILEYGNPGGSPQSSAFNNNHDDPALSADSSDRFAMGLKSSIFRLTSIMRNIVGDNTLGFSSTVDFSDIENITELTILRIFKSSNTLLEIFVTFVIDDQLYHGAFKNYGGINNATFKSEIFLSKDFSKNFMMKLEGIILKALKRFFTPKKGLYKTVKDIVLQDKYGVKHNISSNKPVKVEDIIYEDQYYSIQLDIKTGRNMNETFYLKGLDFFYFNYWFTDYTVEDANS